MNPATADAALRTSQRANKIEPFYVMEMAKTASALAQAVAHTDRPVIFLNIGEPDFAPAPAVQAAAARCIAQGQTPYTPALGLPALRQAIAQWYQSRWGLPVDAQRIVVTAGASGALQLACLALIERGDEVLMPDPSYPCNRHFVSAADGQAVLLPTTAAQRYQPTAEQVQAAWGPRTRGVLLASPSNPTGTSIAPQELQRIVDVVRARGGITLVDEIYLGLSHDDAGGQSALACGDDVISINSFSKYFHMTGWRLGWLVLPPALVPVVERLAQNLFICASSVSQLAALACFEPESLALYEDHRTQFKARRDEVMAALHALGLPVPVAPDGAFYVWADCSAWCQRLGLPDSWAFAHEALSRAHVALTPGRDFGQHETARFIRLSTASSLPQLRAAMQRLGEWLQP